MKSPDVDVQMASAFPRLSLVLGGTKSGKSRYAESLTQQYEEQGRDVVYLATALAPDADFQHRIKQHQQQRPSHWQTIESGFDLAERLREIEQANSNTVVLLDCLTLWLTNELLGKTPDYTLAEPDLCEDRWQQVKDDFIQQLRSTSLTIVMVSNEVGHGIVPLGRLSRVFVDETGLLHQHVAAIADQVVFVTAGLPQRLK